MIQSNFTPLDWTLSETVSELRVGVSAFIRYYNEERLHQALNYKTPYELYFGKKSKAVTHGYVG